jgi:hypothetical protein
VHNVLDAQQRCKVVERRTKKIIAQLRLEKLLEVGRLFAPTWQAFERRACTDKLVVSEVLAGVSHVPR